MKLTDFKVGDRLWLNAAIATIQAGIADKLTKGNITVYRVLNIIRIDINLGAGKCISCWIS